MSTALGMNAGSTTDASEIDDPRILWRLEIEALSLSHERNLREKLPNFLEEGEAGTSMQQPWSPEVWFRKVAAMNLVR